MVVLVNSSQEEEATKEGQTRDLKANTTKAVLNNPDKVSTKTEVLFSTTGKTTTKDHMDNPTQWLSKCNQDSLPSKDLLNNNQWLNQVACPLLVVFLFNSSPRWEQVLSFPLIKHIAKKE